jgi:hypothetical protein
MPNYCVNRLLVEGPEDSIKNFICKSFDSEGLFCFEGTVDPNNPPTKEGWKHKTEILYDDEESNVWGVNRSPLAFKEYQPVLESSTEKFYIEFSTRWAPPTIWVLNLLSLNEFSDLQIQLAYCEQGMEYYGHLKANKTGIVEELKGYIGNGLVLDDKEEDYIVNEKTPFGRFVKKWGFTHFGG